MNRIITCLKRGPLYFLWHKARIKMNQIREQRKKEAYDKYGLDVLRDFSRVAIDNSFNLVCIWGTLLGIIRDNELLPWDDDLDFLLIVDDRKNTIMFEDKLLASGFRLYREFEEEGVVKEKTYVKHGVLCDVRYVNESKEWFTMEETYYELDGVKYTNGRYCEYEVSYMSMPPLIGGKKIKFKSFEVQVPINAEEILEAAYGKNWVTPDRDFVSNREKIRINRKATYYNNFFKKMELLIKKGLCSK